MGETTKISWTDHTFNVAWGCQKISPACQHCYAETWAKRLGLDLWGPGTPRRTFGEKHWDAPLAWNRKAAEAGERRRVFCSSMADVFEDHPTITAERAKLWTLIRRTPWLDWQLLTKRADRIAECLPDDWGDGYPNVWLGVTVEDQQRAEGRIPKLVDVPAVVRFLSVEPMLGEIDLFGDLSDGIPGPAVKEAFDQWESVVYLPMIDWVIVGGESGPKARPFDLVKAGRIVADCDYWGVPVFVKQLGSRPALYGKPFLITDSKGEILDEWPDGLRVREMPGFDRSGQGES